MRVGLIGFGAIGMGVARLLRRAGVDLIVLSVGAWLW
jgi:phosphoglycerate dehydrogenase-like enzyme